MNWKAEATDKLRRYSAMRLAVINLPAEIKRLSLEAQSIRSARTDGDVVVGGGSKREDALINNLLHRKELEETLKQVKLWLTPADLSPASRYGAALPGIGTGAIHNVPETGSSPAAFYPCLLWHQ